MEDLKALKLARYYMSAMSDGINPLNGEYVAENDTIANERVQKCCAYMVDVVDKIIENGGYMKLEFIDKPRCTRKQRDEFIRTSLNKSEIVLSNEPIGVNELARRINAVFGKDIRKISGAKIAAWLAEEDYLDVIKIGNGKKTRKILNGLSEQVGLTSRERVNIETGEVYNQILYTRKAQEFVVENIDKII